MPMVLPVSEPSRPDHWQPRLDPAALAHRPVELDEPPPVLQRDGDDVLRRAAKVDPGRAQDADPAGSRGIEVDVLGADAALDDEPQLRRSRDHLRADATERDRDDLRVADLRGHLRGRRREAVAETDVEAERGVAPGHVHPLRGLGVRDVRAPRHG